MTQGEFLEKLKEALENELSGSIVRENVNYYSNYIKGEIKKGREEEEVTGELGDPWAIARTVIDSYEGQSDVEDTSDYEQKRRSHGDEQRTAQSIHVFGMDAWWKKLLLVLGVIGVILIVMAVISGIFSLLMPVIMPILVVMIIIRFIGGRRK